MCFVSREQCRTQNLENGGAPPTSLAIHDDRVQFETIDNASMLPGIGIGVSAGEF
jgi:hypothetical protein